MSSSNSKPGAAAKAGQGTLSAIAPSNQSLLLDKLNVRRSTPDSEALASSDDDMDPHRQETSQPPVHHSKPARRPSWLNDTSQTAALPHPRKASFASTSMSPTASHPSTPSAESGAGPWGSHSTSSATIGRSSQPQNTFTWGTAIWNPERKEPPSRLAEVLPSPTSVNPPGLGSPGFFGGEQVMPQGSPTARDGSTQQIPFEIPMYPTPKTYRSQSYSVGQLDPDSPGAAAAPPTAAMGGRSRPMGHPGLQHRPSRPSMLSEMSSDGAMLGKVKEVEDDDEGGPGSPEHIPHQQHSVEANKTIELLARENAMLRQQQQYQHAQARLRPRASTAAAYGMGNGYSVRESVPEESEYAIDELDESHDGQDAAARRGLGRRLSEYAASYRSPFSVENRKLENVKKAYWTSSLGFPGLGDIPQSRRHSFADVPTRQASIGSIGDAASLHEARSPDASAGQDFSGLPDTAGFHATSPGGYYQGQMAPSAFGGHYQGIHGHAQGGHGLSSGFGPRPPSPHRNMYGMPGMSQPRHNQLLHIVLFKCSRADVFYIQEGTGLTVKPGDLVIVEADRGTDLGTVARDNVDWQTAKDLKEHYAEEHYKWLMMYSQNAAAAQEGPGAAGLMAASNGMMGGAMGGMGPPGQFHMQEPGAGELKPKLIKRLAQNHEIHNLREKEGNEAKAKRVCMQKVKEHGLNMEILDAEFQMDWKKLTFYYFADAYINFNSLVTDLFKIYKTRIWMSAINPASFASPALGLQAPSGIGPGAVSLGRSGQASNPAPERRSNSALQDAQPAFATAGSPNRPPYQSSVNQHFNAAEAPSMASSAYPPNVFSYSSYGAFGGGSSRGPSYLPSVMQTMEGYPGGFPQAGDFATNMRATRFPSPHGAPSPHDQGSPNMPGQNDWVGNFQGLSLNTR